MKAASLFSTGGRRRRLRGPAPLAALLAFLILGLPLVPYALVPERGGSVPNPGSDLWSEVRQREGPVVGKTQAAGVEPGVLIHPPGEWWRRVRMEQVAPYGAAFLGFNLVVVVLWYALRGRIPIDGGRSGRLVLRFDLAQRLAHWFLASLFLLLALTGLILLYGRMVLIPLLGPDGFAVTASAAKEAHNLFGPIFPFAVLAVLAVFVRGNGLKVLDARWLARGGGLLGRHASAGRYNAGEKLWFWATVGLGLILSVTGLILDFPLFGQGREWMEWSLILHGAAAILLIGGFLGHVYIATLGMEGALESMTDGRVDANWARDHHDLWYQEFKDRESESDTAPDSAAAAPEGATER